MPPPPKKKREKAEPLNLTVFQSEALCLVFDNQKPGEFCFRVVFKK